MKSLSALSVLALVGLAMPALAQTAPAPVASPVVAAPVTAAPPARPDVATFKQQADAGDIIAQYQLAQLYINGLGVAKNPQEAYRYARMAGLRGQRNAQRLMGEIFQNGLVGPANIPEAINWYTKAAEQGDALSCMHLAGLYYDRNPQPPDDLATSYVWMTLATVYGNADAKATREKIAGALTPQQVDQGNATVRQWLQAHQAAAAVAPATRATPSPAPAAPQAAPLRSTVPTPTR